MNRLVSKKILLIPLIAPGAHWIIPSPPAACGHTHRDLLPPTIPSQGRTFETLHPASVRGWGLLCRSAAWPTRSTLDTPAGHLPDPGTSSRYVADARRRSKA